MVRSVCVVALTACLAFPIAAQNATPPERVAQLELDNLNQAQAALKAAEQADAATYATTLYNEASYRLKTAQENWNANKAANREDARLHAVEAMWAARAALAKARWIGTNAAIRSLQSDIARFGGRSDLTLADESPSLAFNRGASSRDRINFAQSVIDAAKAAGAEQFAADDLKVAQQNLETARKITKATATSDNADYLSYTAEMMARRAFYTARGNEATRNITPLQLERTKLAQAESERQAAAERQQRAAAEAHAQQLSQQLAQQQEQDRAARAAAEQTLDQAIARYEKAIASGSATEVENLRRQVEDQQISLRTIQERERMNEQSMTTEIDRLKTDLQTAQNQGSVNAAVLAQRQADLAARQQELDQLRKDREADIAARTRAEEQHQAAVAELTKRRQDAEAQAQALEQQVHEEQAKTQQAQQQQQATQAELEKTRQELASRDAEARQLRMENELARIAATKRDQRGIIVTLPGIFFDTGKSALKPGAKNTLTKIADQLKGSASLRVSVEGHTDSVGSDDSNMTLSDKRAQAVRDFLVNAGVAGDQITASGKGEAEPVATNKTAAGRQQNRRVELVITNT